MQGQSPYLVNLGLFYNHSDWAASLQYNRIGKRLIGVGRSLGTTAGIKPLPSPTRTKCRATCSTFLWLAVLAVLELKLGIKDVLGEKVKFKQFNDVTLSNGQHRKVEEVTRAYNPGRNISLTFGVKL